MACEKSTRTSGKTTPASFRSYTVSTAGAVSTGIGANDNQGVVLDSNRAFVVLPPIGNSFGTAVGRSTFGPGQEKPEIVQLDGPWIDAANSTCTDTGADSVMTVEVDDAAWNVDNADTLQANLVVGSSRVETIATIPPEDWSYTAPVNAGDPGIVSISFEGTGCNWQTQPPPWWLVTGFIIFPGTAIKRLRGRADSRAIRYRYRFDMFGLKTHDPDSGDAIRWSIEFFHGAGGIGSQLGSYHRVFFESDDGAGTIQANLATFFTDLGWGVTGLSVSGGPVHRLPVVIEFTANDGGAQADEFALHWKLQTVGTESTPTPHQDWLGVYNWTTGGLDSHDTFTHQVQKMNDVSGFNKGVVDQWFYFGTYRDPTLPTTIGPGEVLPAKMLPTSLVPTSDGNIAFRARKPGFGFGTRNELCFLVANTGNISRAASAWLETTALKT